MSGRDLGALGAGSRGMVVPVTGGREAKRGIRSDDNPTVLLSGNLGYRPTVQGALWFADRVWPTLVEAVPSARWVLAGARPAAALRRLASRPGIEVHGDVDDLGPFLDRATVAIAPMASGSGVPIKILEAMAAGVPVVVDPWSAGGLADPAAVAVADGEAAWVRILQRLLCVPVEALAQAAAGAEAGAPTIIRAGYGSGSCRLSTSLLRRSGERAHARCLARPMIELVSFFVGLVIGVHNVQVVVSNEVSRVELRLNGETLAEIEGEPWSVPCDFGRDLRPGEFEAVAFDAAGAELARARQWINLPDEGADAGIVAVRDAAGVTSGAQLTWSSPEFGKPRPDHRRARRRPGQGPAPLSHRSSPDSRGQGPRPDGGVRVFA